MMSHVTPTCALIVPYFQKKRANIVHCSYIIYFVSYIICYRRIEYLVTVKLRALSRPFLKKIEWGVVCCRDHLKPEFIHIDCHLLFTDRIVQSASTIVLAGHSSLVPWSAAWCASWVCASQHG